MAHKTKIEIHTGRGTDSLSVRIEDEVSGTALATFRLDPEQLWTVLGGGLVRVEGEISDHLDRVGKRMGWKSETYQQEDFPGERDEKLAHAEAFSRQLYPGWDTYDARFQNSGRVVVTRRRWV